MGTLTPTKEIDEADLNKLKEDIEGVLALFKGFVAKNRPQVNIDEIATGETWLGPDALARSMVDRLATVDDVLLSHAEEGSEVLGVTYTEKPRNPLASLAGAASTEAGGSSIAALALGWLVQKAQVLQGSLLSLCSNKLSLHGAFRECFKHQMSRSRSCRGQRMRLILC